MHGALLRTFPVFFLLLFVSVITARAAHPGTFKVMVVMSYHEAYSWGREIREGVESVLSGAADVKYVYLDTKHNPDGGPAKAREFYEQYRNFHPDGVIAADDAAQYLFVVPYLKDKVKTPVMFCGVNEDPAEYGYPASNVSGIRERIHMEESLAFLRQLVPSVKTFCALMRDDATSRGNLRQLRGEAGSYPVKFVAARFPKTLPEALHMVDEIKDTCDALFVTPMSGVPSRDGRPLSSKEVMPLLIKAYGKPTFSAISNDLKFGVLCSVSQTGQEQGSTAALMLLKAMRGTPVAALPITVNRFGKRMINVSVMKEMGIKPRPVVLRGAELVKSEEQP
jgi:ABC-type uncharacterized transport system substrate-binding protein